MLSSYAYCFEIGDFCISQTRRYWIPAINQEGFQFLIDKKLVVRLVKIKFRRSIGFYQEKKSVDDLLVGSALTACYCYCLYYVEEPLADQ